MGIQLLRIEQDGAHHVGLPAGVTGCAQGLSGIVGFWVSSGNARAPSSGLSFRRPDHDRVAELVSQVKRVGHEVASFLDGSGPKTTSL